MGSKVEKFEKLKKVDPKEFRELTTSTFLIINRNFSSAIPAVCILES